MTWRSASLPPVPEATAAAVKAAFPKGNLYVDLRTEFGSIYRDDLFADFYATRGHPVEIAPWRLALATTIRSLPAGACMVNELWNTMAELTECRLEPKREPARSGDVPHSLADISAARRSVGGLPMTIWPNQPRSTGIVPSFVPAIVIAGSMSFGRFTWPGFVAAVLDHRIAILGPCSHKQVRSLPLQAMSEVHSNAAVI